MVPATEDPGGGPLAVAAPCAFSGSWSRAGTRPAVETARGLGPVTHVSSEDFTHPNTIPRVAQNFGDGLATAQGSVAARWTSLGAQGLQGRS